MRDNPALRPSTPRVPRAAYDAARLAGRAETGAVRFHRSRPYLARGKTRLPHSDRQRGMTAPSSPSSGPSTAASSSTTCWPVTSTDYTGCAGSWRPRYSRPWPQARLVGVEDGRCRRSRSGDFTVAGGSSAGGPVQVVQALAARMHARVDGQTPAGIVLRVVAARRPFPRGPGSP